VIEHTHLPGRNLGRFAPRARIISLGILRELGENCAHGLDLQAAHTRTNRGRRAGELRLIAREAQWSLTEYVCSAGPRDRTFEERHDQVSIAVVTSGTFRYRTDTGEGILYPGAFLLGNAGSCYECGHEHSRGDRCLGLQIDRELFGEIAAGSSGSNRCRFRTAILPAVFDLASISVSFQQASIPDAKPGLEDAILTAVGTVVRIAGTNHRPPRRPNPATTRRMAAVFDYIDARLERDLSLAELSAQVAMSKYHFIRTFKHTSGMTPHQYILGRRIRTAATALRATRKPVARLALDHGFGDLSTFNHLFRRVMGITPTAYRSSI
jgi:AraC family transcriptional regulator